jgi:UDP-glucuronate 4-epimerase
MRRKILITGGAGFIGCHLASDLQRDTRISLIVLLDVFSDVPYGTSLKERRLTDAFGQQMKVTEMRTNLGPGASEIIIIRGDAADQELVASILRKHCIDVVIHLAAQPSVRIQFNTANSWHNNLTALCNVCDAISAESGVAGGARVSRLVSFSSSSVYGTSRLTEGGWTENMPLNPTGTYAMAKAQGEAFLSAWASDKRNHNVRTVIVRPFSVFGEAGRPDMAPLAFFDAVYLGKPVNLAQNDNGEPILRDFTYVGDVGTAVSSILFSENNSIPMGIITAYNIGRGQPTSLGDLLSSIQRILSDKAILTIPIIKPAEDVPATQANTAKALAELDWKPATNLSDGLARMATWYCDLFERRFPIFIAALVTTCGRPELLRRALRSIVIQERAVDTLIVVVDADQNLLPATLLDAEAAVAECNWSRCSIPPRVCVNVRTRGASGAWNTGICEISTIVPKGLHWARVFVAVLDDDDEWTHEHVAACSHVTVTTGAQLVVAGILRKTTPQEEGHRHTVMVPGQLDRNTFYEGNPHLQGSNLFASLAVLARTGLFGEALLSTTDRDLMSRMSALPPHEVGLVSLTSTWSVICHADPQLDRLSCPGSVRKRAGLASFLSIHGPAMTGKQRSGFLKRACDVFNVVDLVSPANPDVETITLPPYQPQHPSVNSQNFLITPTNDATPFPLIVGIIADACDGETIRPLLRDLLKLQSEEGDPNVLIWVIIYQNGDQPNKSILSAAVAGENSNGGLLTSIVSAADVLEDVEKGYFPSPDEVTMCALRSGHRLPIAAARTIVQWYTLCHAEGLKKRASAGNGSGGSCYARDPVVWILDDDKGLDPLRAEQREGRPTNVFRPHWSGKWLLRRALEVHKETNAGIVLGVDTEAPPLPSLSCLRLQLVDVQAVLFAATAAATDGGSLDAPLAPCGSVRRDACLTPSNYGIDGYYDLSSVRSDHLEVPVCPHCLVSSGCWGLSDFPVIAGTPTAADALHLLNSFVLPQIAAGSMVTRPLVTPITSLEPYPSVHRGGCTFIFDLTALRVPNLSPSFGGHATRRSDMIFCILNRWRGVGCVRVPDLTVRHRRVSRDSSSHRLVADAAQTLANDISGHAIYATLQTHQVLPNEFDADNESLLLNNFRKNLKTRSLIVRFSLARIHGLLSICANAVDKNSKGLGAILTPLLQNQLLSSIYSIRTSFCIDKLFPSCPSPWENVSPSFSPVEDALESFHSALKENGVETFIKWLRSLSLSASEWKGPTIATFTSVSDRLRASAAKSVVVGRLQSVNGIAPDVSLVAVGGEGVTLRVPHGSVLKFVQESLGIQRILHDGALAVKVMDIYRLRTAPKAWNDLLAFAATWHQQISDKRTLPHVIGVQDHGKCRGVDLLVRSWLDGKPYSGGRGVHLMRALSNFTLAGVSLGNFSPENILELSSETNEQPSLCLVDIGLDVLRTSPSRIRSCALRAFICWRWAGVLPKRKLNALLEKTRPALLDAGDNPTRLEKLLPEAVGFSAFESAITISTLADTDLENEVEGWLSTVVVGMTKIYSTASPRSFLDFGCYSGSRLLKRIGECSARSGQAPPLLVGYDSNNRITHIPGIDITNSYSHLFSTAESIGGFDVIVCTRGLSEMQQGHDVDIELMEKLCSYISRSGKVLIAVRPSPEILSVRSSSSLNTHLRIHRPLYVLRRLLRQAGMEMIRAQPTNEGPLNVDLNSYLFFPKFFIFSCVQSLKISSPLVPQLRTALLIRASGIDWQMLPQTIKHCVSSLEGPHFFDGGIHLVLDIPILHALPCNSATLTHICTTLKSQGVINFFYDTSITDLKSVTELNQRWYGMSSTATHAFNGSPSYSTIYAYECISMLGAELVLTVDSDIMFRRGYDERGTRSPFLSQVHTLFQEDTTAVTLSLPVISPLPPEPTYAPFTSCNSKREPWRVESRACFLHLPRIMRLRPFPSDYKTDFPTSEPTLLPWYQAIDRLICSSDNRLSSIRGGDSSGVSFVQPSDKVKSNRKDYGLLIDYIERGGPLPPALASCDKALPGGFSDCARYAQKIMASGAPTRGAWSRPEQYVFVATGCRVPLGAVRRCLLSIAAQTLPEGVSFGLIVVWDDPTQLEVVDDEDTGEYIERMISGLPSGLEGRTTFLKPRFRCGFVANLLTCACSVIAFPSTVVIPVDLNDCFIGTDVLLTVHAAFSKHGVDILSGGVLSTTIGKQIDQKTDVDDRPWPLACWQSQSEEPFYQASPLCVVRSAAYRALRHTDIENDPCNLKAGWNQLIMRLTEMATRAAAPTSNIYFCDRFSEAPSSLDSPYRGHFHYPYLPRRVAVIGNARLETGSPVDVTAEALGYSLAASGYLVVSGGLAGAMEASCRGAARATSELGRAPTSSRHGNLQIWMRAPPLPGPLGILPGADHAPNPYVGTVVHTGIGHARNSIVACSADAVVIIGGGAGTIAEAAAAWTAARLVVALVGSGGAADLFAGIRMDSRQRLHGESAAAIPKEQDVVHAAQNVAHAVALIDQLLHWHRIESLRKASATPGSMAPSW